MNCRVMKKEEFVERMLADQELRKKEAAYRARDVLYSYYKARDLQILKRKHQNTASRFKQGRGSR